MKLKAKTEVKTAPHPLTIGLPRLSLVVATAALSFIVLFLLTVPESTADTPVYVNQIFQYYQQGASASPLLLWEFGHLLWRPLGYGLWRAFHSTLSPWSGNNPYLEITAVLMGINFAVGMALTLLLFFVCSKLGLSMRAALAVTAGFMLFSTILRYIHSGMSYNLGFALQLTGLLLIVRAAHAARRRKELWATLAGVALSLSFAVWFPYVLTVPAILLAGCYAGPPETRAPRRQMRLFAIAGAAIAVVGLATFGLAAWIDHLSSYAALKQWVMNSAHGVANQRTLIRLPTGVTRSFLHLGDDGILLKRFVMGDPYAPVHPVELMKAGLWKIAAVFLTLAILVVTLVRHKEAWPALAVLVCGSLPVLGFAVLLFKDTAEPARYEPAYASLLVSVCAMVLLKDKERAALRLLVAFALVMACVNLSAYALTLRSANAVAAERATLVHEHTVHNGVAVLLSFRDPVSGFVQAAPFSQLNRPGALPLYHAIEPGNINVLRWRQDAACRILAAWDSGGEAWLSERLISPRPKPEWNWVEYDDNRVKWTDLPDFFSRFERDDHIGADDGFFRLALTANNRTLLRSICGQQ